MACCNKTDPEQALRSGAVEQAVKVLTNRLGGYGVEGIVVQQHGDRQIVVQLPGLCDSDDSFCINAPP